MSAVTHWFACGCGRNFVEHHPEGVAAEGRCPDCGAQADRRTVSETAEKIAQCAKPTKERRIKAQA